MIYNIDRIRLVSSNVTCQWVSFWPPKYTFGKVIALLFLAQNMEQRGWKLYERLSEGGSELSRRQRDDSFET